MWKRSTISCAGMTASVPSPHAASRYASSACRTAKRSGTTGPAGRSPRPSCGCAGAAVGTLDPPGGVAGELDARLADEVADLPGRPPAVHVDVEIRRDAEVAL